MKQFVSYCALIFFSTLFVGCLYSGPSTPVAPVEPVTPVPLPDAPSVALQQKVAPLKGVISAPEDAVLAASFFEAFADVIERDDSIITTTGTLREGYIRAETLMLQKTDMVGRYPGFGAKKDAVLEEVLGLDNVALTPEKRQEAVDVFKAIAWVIGGSNG